MFVLGITWDVPHVYLIVETKSLIRLFNLKKI